MGLFAGFAIGAGLRNARNVLTAANGDIDSARMFGAADKVDPVKRLLGTASGWGGDPREDAFYAGAMPAGNDGKTACRLIRDVPVDGLPSIGLYDKDGYLEMNDRGACSGNNVTARKWADGTVAIQFGKCEGFEGNWLPITPGWNHRVRMYRPRPEIVHGTWIFAEAVEVD
jgi:hypothetical protein